jgi:hypothetical protein
MTVGRESLLLEELYYDFIHSLHLMHKVNAQ